MSIVASNRSPPLRQRWQAACNAALVALRNLRRQFRRSLASLLSIAFGVAALLVASAYTEALFVEFREATIQSQFGHLQVTRPGFHQRGRSDPWAYLLPADQSSLSALLPAGARLAPRLLINGLASHGDHTLPFMAEAIDPAVDMRDDSALNILQGERMQPHVAEQVLLGQGLARQLNVGVGDAVVLLTTTPDGQLAAAEAPVVGVFASISDAFDDAALYMPLALGHQLTHQEGAHAWLVFLDETASTDSVLQSLRSELPDALDVQPWHRLAEFYRRAAALFDQQLALVKGIVVVIILLGIGNTMMMSVLERTGEIGTMMALGARRGAVLRGFLLEGALLGLMGAVIGVLAALALAAMLQVLAIDMPPPPGFTRGYLAALRFTPGLVVETVLLAVLTTTLAAFYPALRASRMVIVDALRALR